jgi:hypothetical protein
MCSFHRMFKLHILCIEYLRRQRKVELILYSWNCSDMWTDVGMLEIIEQIVKSWCNELYMVLCCTPCEDFWTSTPSCFATTFLKIYFKCNVWSKRGDRRAECCCQGLDKTLAKSASGFFNSQQIFLKFIVVMTL